MSTNIENMMEIGPVVAEINYLVGYADFSRLIQKCAVVTLVISEVSGYWTYLD